MNDQTNSETINFYLVKQTIKYVSSIVNDDQLKVPNLIKLNNSICAAFAEDDTVTDNAAINLTSKINRTDFQKHFNQLYYLALQDTYSLEDSDVKNSFPFVPLNILSINTDDLDLLLVGLIQQASQSLLVLAETEMIGNYGIVQSDFVKIFSSLNNDLSNRGFIIRNNDGLDFSNKTNQDKEAFIDYFMDISEVAQNYLEENAEYKI